MKCCSTCKVQLPLECFGVRKDASDGLRSNCKPCHKDSKDAWRRRNPHMGLEYKRRWRERYPEKASAAASAQAKRWRAAAPQKRRASEKRWRDANPGHKAVRTRRLRTQMPSWACRDAIRQVYREARHLEKLDGQKRHVDHVIPLKGKTVCGLHVAENLQILLASENLRKSNKVLA